MWTCWTSSSVGYQLLSSGPQVLMAGATAFRQILQFEALDILDRPNSVRFFKWGFPARHRATPSTIILILIGCFPEQKPYIWGYPHGYGNLQIILRSTSCLPRSSRIDFIEMPKGAATNELGRMERLKPGHQGCDPWPYWLCLLDWYQMISSDLILGRQNLSHSHFIDVQVRFICSTPKIVNGKISMLDADPILDALKIPFLQMKFEECHSRRLNPKCHSMLRTRSAHHSLVNHCSFFADA